MSVLLQTTFDIVTATEGQALLVVGITAMLLFAAITLRNPAALVSWGLSVVLLVLSAVLNLGSEWFWLGILITSILVAVGAVARWMQ